MTAKEKFLTVESYEEFDRRRDEFKELKMTDKEVREHVRKIFPKVSDTKEELYKTPPQAGKKRSIGR